MSDWSEETPLTRRWRTPARIGALVLPLVSCAILSTLRDSVTAATAVLILVLWVVAAAASGDRLAGLLAALSGGAWFDFFLTEPYQRFTIADPDDIEATVLLVLIGAGVTEIALWGHRQQGRAARRSGYLEGVLGTAQVVSEGDAPASSPGRGRRPPDHRRAGSRRLPLRRRPGPRHADRAARPRRRGHPRWPRRRRRSTRPSRRRATSPSSSGRDPCVVGHFLVTATTRVAYPSREQCRVAVLLADQVAGALDAE